jgi:hypothetical protein
MQATFEKKRKKKKKYKYLAFLKQMTNMLFKGLSTNQFTNNMFLIRANLGFIEVPHFKIV